MSGKVYRLAASSSVASTILISEMPKERRAIALGSFTSSRRLLPFAFGHLSLPLYETDS